MRLQWQYPSDDGGAIIDNYTFKLYHNDALIEILNTSILEYYFVGLNYTTNYSVSISAMNCAGAGNPIMQHIFEGKKDIILYIKRSHSFPQLVVVLHCFQQVVL